MYLSNKPETTKQTSNHLGIDYTVLHPREVEFPATCHVLQCFANLQNDSDITYNSLNNELNRLGYGMNIADFIIHVNSKARHLKTGVNHIEKGRVECCLGQSMENYGFHRICKKFKNNIEVPFIDPEISKNLFRFDGVDVHIEKKDKKKRKKRDLDVNVSLVSENYDKNKKNFVRETMNVPEIVEKDRNDEMTSSFLEMPPLFNESYVNLYCETNC